MSRSLLISRTSLSLTDLELWSPPNSFIVGDSFGPGAQVNRRQTAASPFVPGRFAIGITQDSQDAQLLLEIAGSSGADLTTRVGVVLAAFKQFTYTLTWNFDGITNSYACEAADFSVGEGGLMEDIDIAFHAARISLTIPHDPIPLSGTF